MFSAGAPPATQPFEFVHKCRSELIQEANSGTYPNIIETSVSYKSNREFGVIFTVIVYDGDPRPDEAEGAFFEDAGLSLVPA
ncbi:hypothetical protein [Trueperella pyogenes]|uniref:hypothetical protein n=1 Tax=Trueperella pyogenes TaxID=1661 RepID=UPI0023DE179A|nr:hypothetical protein [Trueperella pyogenes]MDF2420712.1 hypothetical protein [Trueperella pyogenes]WHU58192.1 hypothetical protein QEV21_05685 [Trueperella pyogenes]